ncbi:DNA-binding LytR/AlgR family response regulator [Aquimarina sp. EL_43]|uniref:LytR/AlgR family response regulator transcription factor n=1 Tax=Aquimarina TaxID=290174 RepID=UPI00047190D9|nr:MULTISPECIES: LytTR family DNA-binding domain-containing protein [Aquimarina]MBG6129505.1 DNA-binding LytR/AlgR family response regulator [Aquimarina sp. EL_35]MBG6150570.1 DNA-binding LytR/AlgR family response regulator [Aquimarina sp. EL_32]MBG6168122.1 DNA-binding LytR/AlgR family response regulator [Aquimarina sp. EL_43]
MKILIVEDEPRAASQLQNLLKKSTLDFQLLDIIDTVEDAVVWFQKNTTPELVFMDIQLADGLSFEIFQKVEVTAPIIFTTAFDQYAIQAFKVNSIDYLLKPIQQKDLDAALHKFSKSKSLSNPIEPNILKELLSSIQTPQKRSGILVKEGSGFVQIRVSELLYIYSQDSITFGITHNKRYIIDETMDQLFDSLDDTKFYRINRGQIISKISIQKIEPYFNHRVKLSVSNPRDQEFIVSRQKTSDFKDWMNK